MKRALAATALLFMLAACGKKDAVSSQTGSAPATTSAAAANLTPEQLGELGAKIQKDPSHAEDLLSQQGLTQESFEKAIRDVTEDPAAARRYAGAFRRASA
jgi:hypothetical protein